MPATDSIDSPPSCEAGPSRLPSSRPSSPLTPRTPPRKTFYPVWPDTHEDAEYFEIPPDHFLAQQKGAQKTRRATTSSPPTSDAQVDSQSLSSSTAASRQSTLQHVPDSQPLAELATAIQAGIPAVPAPSGLTAAFQDRPIDAVPRPPGFSTIHDQIPDTSTLAAADFDVDVRSGFLPPEQPVLRLSGPHEQLWEAALDQAKRIPLMQGGGGIKTTREQRIQARRWRRHIRDMPVLPLSEELANDIRYARRGHVVLSFLAHFYIHSQPRKSTEPVLPQGRGWLDVFSRKSAEEVREEQDQANEVAGKYARRLPASIAVPWVQLSQKLDLPPILTYASTVLWNWAYIDPKRGLEPDNLRILETFTGTRSEEHFFLTSLLIEARGVEALDLMRVSLDEAFVGDRVARRRIAGYLNRLAVVIQDLASLLHDVRTHCDPKVFYWGIRPWFVGSDTVEKGEKPGWHFEGVDPEGVMRTFSGPSAGQSSMIHAIDVFLDVDHTRRKERPNRPASSSNADTRGADATFMERMQLYMPGHHRAFLTHLRNISFEEDDDERDGDLNQDRLQGSRLLDGNEGEDEETASTTPPSSPAPHPIRSLALKAREEAYDEGLPAAYDGALAALKALRDEHMKVAYLYIIAQARGSPPDEYAPLPKGFTGDPDLDRRLATKAKVDAGPSPLESNVKDRDGVAKGTGGTDLVSFLRDCRVNTIDTLITTKNLAKDMVKEGMAVGSTEKTETLSSGDRVDTSGAGALSTGQSSSSFGSPSGHLLSSQTDIASAETPHPSTVRLQVWAVNIAGWHPASDDSFKDLVSQLLLDEHSQEERTKVMRYYKQIDRTRSLVARLLPRLMLAEHYGVAWGQARFETTREGRPYLASPSQTPPVDFNISHDHDWVVLAFHLPPADKPSKIAHGSMSQVTHSSLEVSARSISTMRVGVDVMSLSLPKYEHSVRSFAETMDLALTSTELRWILAPLSEASSQPSETREEEALHRLYKFWTHKEAFTKNIGKGLGFDFTMVQFDFEAPTPRLHVAGKLESRYRFTDILLPSDTSHAPSQLVVCEGPFDTSGFQQPPSRLTAEEAQDAQVLKIWSIHELLARTSSVSGSPLN